MNGVPKEIKEFIDEFLNKKPDPHEQYLDWIAKCPLPLDYNKLDKYMKSIHPEWFL